MVSVTVLIDKLTYLERCVGVESDSAVRKRVIDAQDCALLVQREVAETLRRGSGSNGVRITGEVPLSSVLPRPVWKRLLRLQSPK